MERSIGFKAFKLVLGALCAMLCALALTCTDALAYFTATDAVAYSFEVGDVAPAELEAFAVYSADDKSLSFYKRASVPVAGDTFEGKTVTNVYRGIEDLYVPETKAVAAPWTKVSTTIARIAVVDPIAPNSCRSWFNLCRSAAEISGLDKLETSHVLSFTKMFAECTSLAALDVADWDTSAALSMKGMFYKCQKLVGLDVSKWDVSSVVDMSDMFNECRALTSLDVAAWDTGSLVDSYAMFMYCLSLSALDVSGWSMGSVTSLSSMFMWCSSLPSLDLSRWDVHSTTSMYGMFDNCTALATIGDVSDWDTSSLLSLANMFSNCASLVALDASNWNTSSVISLNYMFDTCPSLSVLDASEWDTSAVTTMTRMLYKCSSLETMYVGVGWTTASCSGSSSTRYLFNGCTSIVGGNGTKYSSAHTDGSYACIDKPGQPGYLTLKHDAFSYTEQYDLGTGVMEDDGDCADYLSDAEDDQEASLDDGHASIEDLKRPDCMLEDEAIPDDDGTEAIE